MKLSRRFCFLFFSLYFILVRPKLVVRVSNDGGEVFSESFDANVSTGLIDSTFPLGDGSILRHFIDTKENLEIFKVTIPPELDLHETAMRHLCFIIRLPVDQYIAPDALSKLRQKNPTAVRRAEDDRGMGEHDMDVCVKVDKSQLLSAHVYAHCQSAEFSTYARQSDVDYLTSARQRHLLPTAVQSCASEATALECLTQRFTPSGSGFADRPCLCRYHLCMLWYPCQLKFCHSKTNNDAYRCGIKTCRRCHGFTFRAAKPIDCPFQE